MSVLNLLTKPARLRYVRTVGSDKYGQPVQETSFDSTFCYYRMQNTSIGDAVYQQEERLRVTLPADTDLSGLTGVEIDGVMLEPAGIPHKQWNPRTSDVQYVMVPVRLATS